jgi:recombination protein RecR
MKTIVDQVPSLQQLIFQLQKVPYLASKNVYRVAHYFLQLSSEQREQFCQTVVQASQQLVTCPTCCVWQEKGVPCFFCGNSMRDQKTICVVQIWYDILAIEKAETYKGVYHVLGGVLAPLEGVGVAQLAIEPLLKRALQCDEIIFAFSQTPEGETTAAYIADKLKNLPVKITCLAQGMPVGGSLEFMDRLTIYKALSQRREF